MNYVGLSLTLRSVCVLTDVERDELSKKADSLPEPSRCAEITQQRVLGDLICLMSHISTSSSNTYFIICSMSHISTSCLNDCAD